MTELFHREVPTVDGLYRSHSEYTGVVGGSRASQRVRDHLTEQIEIREATRMARNKEKDYSSQVVGGVKLIKPDIL